MNVFHLAPQGNDRELPGPADLNAVPAGDGVMITGTHAPEEVARWAVAIGSAVLRGVKVGRE
ncbi:hypothetical protein [Micromonospora sp. NPDC023956]|uniref:hypothetical protein n=1 Tax=Micromonospora sp. NPDC023956 TaxID=3155722 RepID=UPI00340F3DF0